MKITDVKKCVWWALILTAIVAIAAVFVDGLHLQILSVSSAEICFFYFFLLIIGFSVALGLVILLMLLVARISNGIRCKRSGSEVAKEPLCEEDSLNVSKEISSAACLTAIVAVVYTITGEVSWIEEWRTALLTLAIGFLAALGFLTLWNILVRWLSKKFR